MIEKLYDVIDMGHSRNFVNNKFCIIQWCMNIREDHRQKKRWCSLAHLPWLPSALPSPINWPRAPWRVEPLYFRPVCIARSSWGSRKRRLAGVKKTVQRCTMLLHWPKILSLFPLPPKTKPPLNSSHVFCLFVQTLFPTLYPHSVLAPLRLESCVFALLKRRYRLL